MSDVCRLIRRVVVVGYGNIGRRHVENCLLLFPNATVYVVSSSQRELHLTGKRVKQISLEEAAGGKPDMAIIASPSSLHFAHSRLFIEHKVPLLIEKPVTANSEMAQSLCDIAGDVAISVGYCLRYLPAFAKMQQLVADNVLGPVLNISVSVGQFLPEWRKYTDVERSVTVSRQLGGGVMLELSHELDYLQALFGSLSPLSCVTTQTAVFSTEVELQADMFLMANHKVPCFVHLDATQKVGHRYCHIIGSEANVFWDLKQNTITLERKLERDIVYAEPNYDRNLMYLNMLKDFADCVHFKKSMPVSLRSAVSIVNLIDNLKHIAVENIAP